MNQEEMSAAVPLDHQFAGTAGVHCAEPAEVQSAGTVGALPGVIESLTRHCKRGKRRCAAATV